MFLIDDILCSPARGLLFVFREIQKAAQQERVDEAQQIRTALSELYMMLETGRITEQDFDTREHGLLDRLDAAEAVGAGA